MDSSITVWDVKQREAKHNFYVAGAATWALVFAPDSSIISTAHQTGNVYLWDTESADLIFVLKRGHQGAARSVAFDPMARFLASGGEDGVINLWGDPSRVPQPYFRIPKRDQRDRRQPSAGSQALWTKLCQTVLPCIQS